MSLTISAQLFGKFECRMDDLRAAIAEEDMGDAQKMMKRMTKLFAEIRGTATTAAVASEEVSKVKKSRKTKGDGEKKPVVPGSWPDQLQKVYAPVINEAWGSEKKPAGILMKVAGYLKKQGKTEPTVKDAREAIAFIRENPDYKSDTQISRSEDGSVKEGAKKKRAYKKKAVSEEKTPAAAKAEEVIAKMKEVLSDAEEDEEEDEEDEEEEIDLATFEYKGNSYLKDPFQEVYTSEGKLEWVGTYNGKKIVKGEMPLRVKKYIESQE
jgi:hypothetical protein